MAKPEQESPIEDLQQKLDTPNVDVSRTFQRTGFHQEAHDAPTDWTHTHDQKDILSRMRFTKKHKRLATWLFIVSVTFFAIAVLTALFYLTGNRNVLSSDKIDIQVTGPTKVAAGDKMPLAIEITNNNVSALQAADLLIEYPQGTRSAEDITIPLPRSRMGLGDILPGQHVATTAEATIFGEQGTKQQINISLEYRVAGSGAIFVKERAFDVEINNSPIRLNIDAPKSINSGTDVTLNVTVTSNSPTPLQDVILKGDYPFGFTYGSATPKPTFSTDTWSLGDLPPSGSATIQITGKLEGQHDEERIFRFEIGVANNNGDPTDIGTSFAQAQHTVTIARPFVDLAFSVNGQTGNTLTVPAGKDVSLDVLWRNNLPDALGDAVLTLKMDGQGIDEQSIKSSSGFYDSSTNTFTWDKRTVPDFAVLDGGSSGRLGLQFTTLTPQQMGGNNINPVINLDLSLQGVPIGNTDTPELVKTDVKGQLKIGTSAGFAMQILHGSGPIDNTGPMPPKVENETTYTVVWNIASSVNDLTQTTVRGKLPPYVSWKGSVKPSGEDVTFDPSTGMVTWNAGTVRAGAGYKSPAKSVAFQIGFTPSANQVGSTPTLVDGAAMVAVDGFSGAQVSALVEPETTLLSNDPTFNGDEDRVVQ